LGLGEKRKQEKRAGKESPVKKRAKQEFPISFLPKLFKEKRRANRQGQSGGHGEVKYALTYRNQKERQGRMRDVEIHTTDTQETKADGG